MEMQNHKSSAAKHIEPTQKYLDVAEIKEDTIIMKDGSIRAVVVVSSTNFALKSEEEQNALISGYQNFLNSLDFPIQILIHSRILDIDGYLEKLRSLTASQTNELLRIQMTEYIEYISHLVEYANIMSKTFYVIVPYSATPVKQTLGSKIVRILNPAAQIATSQEGFEKAKVKLEERISHVSSGLGGMGLRSLVLNTEELIELLYNSYNFESGSPLAPREIAELDLEEQAAKSLS
jgi:type IV secretory pathway VirB4 component